MATLWVAEMNDDLTGNLLIKVESRSARNSLVGHGWGYATWTARWDRGKKYEETLFCNVPGLTGTGHGEPLQGRQLEYIFHDTGIL